jgi:DNA-directed RNA polymerase subunit H (RpoH/RPB5)
MSLNKVLNNIYNNLFEFINYRNLTLLDNKLETEEFNKTLQYNKYVSIKTFNNIELKYDHDIIEELKKYVNESPSNKLSKNKKLPKNDEFDNIVIINIVLLHNDTEYDSKSSEFNKLIDIVKFPKCELLIISRTDFSTHVHKKLRSISTKDILIYNYPYRLFKIIIPNHILCSKHRILSKNETEYLLNNELFSEKKNLPKIEKNDPQIIWIGGKKNDVIEIQRKSETSCLSLEYRLVI